MQVTQQERARFRVLDREQNAYELIWQPRVESAITKQIKPFLAALREKGPDYALSNINDLITPDALAEVLLPLWVKVGTQAANSEWGNIQKLYGAEINQAKRFGFNQIWANIMRAVFNRTGGERIVKITQTEHDRVRTELEAAIQNPKYTYYELAERLQSSDIPRHRSKVIARTETAYAASEGGEAAAKRSGILMIKTWLSARDKRTRHPPRDTANHVVMDGVKVPMNEKFLVPSKKGMSLMDRPHDLTAPAYQTIMCRCKAIYTASRDLAGRLIRVSNNTTPSI